MQPIQDLLVAYTETSLADTGRRGVRGVSVAVDRVLGLRAGALSNAALAVAADRAAARTRRDVARALERDALHAQLLELPRAT